jgi:hypothetical protein
MGPARRSRKPGVTYEGDRLHDDRSSARRAPVSRPLQHGRDPIPGTSKGGDPCAVRSTRRELSATRGRGHLWRARTWGARPRVYRGHGLDRYPWSSTSTISLAAAPCGFAGHSLRRSSFFRQSIRPFDEPLHAPSLNHDHFDVFEGGARLTSRRAAHHPRVLPEGRNIVSASRDGRSSAQTVKRSYWCRCGASTMAANRGRLISRLCHQCRVRRFPYRRRAMRRSSRGGARGIDASARSPFLDDATQHSEAHGCADAYQMLMVRRDRGDDPGSNPL